VLAVAACGSSGNASKTGTTTRLTATEYRTKLAQIAQEADVVQGSVEQGLKAKSVARLDAILSKFADSSQRLGVEVAALSPPQNAVAANSELARGESDTASATRAALAKLSGMKSMKAALAYLQSSQANAKGGHELDDALTKLKKLGYTKGS
jgi:type IV pilus biogenesis protein CpaD/CtpE